MDLTLSQKSTKHQQTKEQITYEHRPTANRDICEHCGTQHRWPQRNHKQRYLQTSPRPLSSPPQLSPPFGTSDSKCFKYYSSPYWQSGDRPIGSHNSQSQRWSLWRKGEANVKWDPLDPLWPTESCPLLKSLGKHAHKTECLKLILLVKAKEQLRNSGSWPQDREAVQDQGERGTGLDIDASPAGDASPALGGLS